MADKDIIVALELATTAVRAIAGQRMADGTMQIKAIVEENASNCIRKGVVDNIDKTTQAISRVLAQISLQLGQSVRRVYVGLSGQSLHTVLNKIQRQLTEKTQVTNDMIDQMMDTNRGVVYTNSEILEVVPQEYHVGIREEADIVGMQVDQLEARFLNVIARNSLQENIEKCVRSAGYEIAELLIAPLALADTLLNAAEKRSGCALVDLGADTTTVSIYTKNILRKLCVIPLGGSNVTADIANCLSVEYEEAETLKLRHGHAWKQFANDEESKSISISHDRNVDEKDLSNIIQARYEEILMNVWNQLKSDSDKLVSGIVFTGGASQIRSLQDAFQKFAHTNKTIRIAKLPSEISTATGIHIADNERMNTIIALLLHGDQNCVSRETQETVKEPIPVVEAKPAPAEPAEPVAPKQPKKTWWEKIKDSLDQDE
ncbi:MAG: cell division protein FtsA [Bacteroidaceae bacterium]|nr:cell division protein FtsA [Bacteroidaceae bacterium]